MTEEDNFFKELMLHGEQEMPYSGIEDEIMVRIDKLELEKNAIREGYRRGIAFSWFFFVIGIVSGIALIIMMPQMELHFFNEYSGAIPLIFQAGFILFVLIHFEKLMKMTRGKSQAL